MLLIAAEPVIDDGFSAFTPLHAVTFLAFLAATAVVIAIGLGARRRGVEDHWRRTLGWAGLLFFVVHQWYWFTPPRLDLADSLPLHICDLNGLVAPLALLTRVRWLRATLYFWGIGLTLQGLVQPVASVTGPDTPRFWFFFVSHGVIVGFALYDVVVGRYRAVWRDVVLMLLISLAYFAVVIPIDVVTGWNYGFLGKQDAQPGFIKALGAWPGRVIRLFGIGAATFVLLWAPFAVYARVNGRSR